MPNETHYPTDEHEAESKQFDGKAISRAIVFATLAVVGLGLVSVLAFSPLNWFIPTILYALGVYFAWQHFF